MKRERMSAILIREREWHKPFRGKSNHSADYEDGFLAGLQQAIDLSKQYEAKPDAGKGE